MENNAKKNQLPPELEWDQMQSGILNKMETIERQERLRRTRVGAIIATLVAVILAILLLGPCKSLLENSDGPTSDKGTSSLSNSTPALTPSNTLDDIQAESVGSDRSASIDDGIVLPDANSDFRNPSNGPLSQSKGSSKNEVTDLSHHVPGSGLRSSSIAINQSDTPMDSQVNAQDQSTSLISKAEAENEIPNAKQDPSSKDRDDRDIQSFVQLPPEEISALVMSEDNANIIAPLKDNSRPEARISIIGGAAFWNMGYGANEPERAVFEETLVSFTGGINYMHVLPSGFFGMVGLNYTQLESRFEWSQQLDNYTITLTDTIVEVQVNTLTGDFANVRGDVDVSVGAERKVIHYNSTRLVQVPLAIGKTWTWSRWRADLMLGGVLNVHAANAGRTLYQGELLDYDGATTDFMSNQWSVHGMGMANVTYRVTPRLGVTAALQFQKSLSNWSTEEGISMRPWIFGGQVGLTYSFE